MKLQDLQSIADTVGEALLPIVGIVLAAIAARWLINRLIQRITRRLVGTTWLERREQRLRAVASISQSVTTGVVTVMAGVAIASLFIDVTPFLTGVGLLSVVLGLGAQSVIKDFLDGIFMIVEDQFGVGDYVHCDAIAGTVTAVGLRVTTIRDDSGTVWHVRNGTISRLGNASQGWSTAQVTLPLADLAALAEFTSIAHDTTAALAARPGPGAAISSEPMISVDEATGEAVAVTVRVRVTAGSAQTVARALRAELAAALKEAKIELGPGIGVSGAKP